MVELLELTQCNELFFRIFARSVGDRCRLCDFHVFVQYNHIFELTSSVIL